MKQGEYTKQRITRIANELFYQKGYASTSFSDIQQASKLSKGNITYHFKNKALILQSVVNKRLQDIEAQFDQWQQIMPDPSHRLNRFCDMLLIEQEKLSQFGCPMGTLTGELAKNSPELYPIVIPMFQTFRNWLSGQFESLGFDHIQSDQKAMALLAQVQGIAVMSHVFRDPEFLSVQIDQLKLKIDQPKLKIDQGLSQN